MPKKVLKKKEGKSAPQAQEVRPKAFLDLIAPAAVQFTTAHSSLSIVFCRIVVRSLLRLHSTIGSADGYRKRKINY